MIPALSGLIALVIIAIFISAIRMSYAVEERSGKHVAGKLRRTNIWAVALNIGVATDAETQKLRKQVNSRLLIIAGLFVALAFAAFSLSAGK